MIMDLSRSNNATKIIAEIKRVKEDLSIYNKIDAETLHDDYPIYLFISPFKSSIFVTYKDVKNLFASKINDLKNKLQELEKELDKI